MAETPFTFTSLSINDLFFMMEGAKRTMTLFFWSVIFGTALGVMLGWARASANVAINFAIGACIDVLRSVPLIIQFILFNSAVSVFGFPMDAFYSGVVVLTLYMGAYCSEVVRSGFKAVPPITRRAARSLGLTYWQDLRYIVFPIGTRAVFPAWIGLVVGILKDTALVTVLGYIELLRAAEIIISRTQEPLLVLIGVGIFYFILCYPISKYSAHLERKMAT